jgi:hypothetical protein
LLGDADQAIERPARSGSTTISIRRRPPWWKPSRSNLKPKINSFARLREYQPWITNPVYWALREKTVNVGLRRTGFSEK